MYICKKLVNIFEIENRGASEYKKEKKKKKSLGHDRKISSLSEKIG